MFWTDNGREYVNRDVRGVLDECGIQHTTTPPYHAQANPVERINRDLKTMIMSYLNDDHREWDKYIYEFQFAHNTAKHDSLGVSPAFLNFGRDPCPMHPMGLNQNGAIVIEEPTEVAAWIHRMDRLVELQDIVNVNIRRAAERQARYYNPRRRVVNFAVGDLVYRPNKVLSKKSEQVVGKLAPRFVGPFVVSAVPTPVIVELHTPEGVPVGKCHVKNLKLALRADEQPGNP